MYTPEEEKEIKHIMENYDLMDDAEREKYIIFGDGMTAATKKEKGIDIEIFK